MFIHERYDVLECLHQGSASIVYRARDRQHHTSVILKIARRVESSAARLRHEYSILKDLDIEGVVRARAFVVEPDTVVLVSDDVQGVTLSSRLAQGPLGLPEALRVAIAVVGTIGRLHERHVIHKDINASNILLSADGQVWIFDFDISTRLSREVQKFQSPNQLTGTLAYIAPEQTGRMSRTIDYRADLYSFGATLYEMLTGRVPFLSRDPIELVHCHLAKTPSPPSEIDPRVPAVVSDVVMKLLEKTAEARYQSAFGLKLDLEECLRRLTPEGHVEPFTLAERDISDRFQIPEKLYGRAEETAALERALERVKAGAPELVLVTGTSGIGKSSVIYALHKALSRSRGHFVSGKFDQLQRDIPYSALLSALSGLTRALLTEPEDELERFRQLILSAAKGAGHVLIDLLPDLVHVIGPQPQVPALLGAASRSRFRLLLASFLQVFTRHGRPLVLFLDDLQWADAATLDLLPALIGDPQAGALLLIGAYRDNEVGPMHPLLATLAPLEEKQSSRVTRVEVGPIGVDDVEQIVVDALSISPREARPLAELLWRRSGGNPFFVGELLKLLHRGGLIEFNPQHRSWSFDLEQIARAPGTESIAEVMAVRAAGLRPGTQQILKLAAVLGHYFDLEALAVVAERTVEVVSEALEEATREGLILAVAQAPQRGYRFLHDRIQQTVYTSIPDAERVLIHYRTGQLLWSSRPGGDVTAWQFEVLRHLNLASSWVNDPDERLSLARLNLAAAERARASGALAAANHHYAMGITFLPVAAWRHEHDMMFALHLGGAECAYLCGDHAAAEELFAVLVERAATDEERARVYECIALFRNHTHDTQGACRAGLEGLACLGVHLDPDPGWPRVALEMMRTRRALGGRKMPELLQIPEATDLRAKLALRLLMSMVTASFHMERPLFFQVCLTMVRLSVEHGHTSASAVGYTQFAFMYIDVFQDYAAADDFGKLALGLLERYPDKTVEASVKLLYGWGICMWRNPAEDGLRYAMEALQCGSLSGDLGNVGYGIVATVLSLWFMGRPLDGFLLACADNLDTAHKIKHGYALDIITSLRQAALVLQGRTQGPGSFDAIDFDDARHVAQLASRASKRGLNFYLTSKIRVHYILGQHAEASACVDELVQRNSSPAFSECELYAGLILVERAMTEGVLGRERCLLLARAHLFKLKRWADNAPMNFKHKYLLLAAGIARVTGDEQLALGQYEEAIALAREHEFIHDEAIAHELASRAYRARGHEHAAMRHLAQARGAYARWGAHAKVALLDREYVGIALSADVDPRASGPQIAGSTTTSSGTLDVPSMIKASQALSGEISLDKLLLRLMAIVAENAGASRGALVMEVHGERVIMAEFEAVGGARLPARPEPIAGSSKVPASIIAYVFRTREGVMLRDAASEGVFGVDPYITRTQAKAVLCAPLVNQGVVAGALYLENNLIPGAFTEERAELLSILCAQMAISIENANLYDDLEQKVRERTRALEKAQARVVQLEKDTTEIQMAGGFAHEMRNALTGAKLVMSKVYRAKDGTTWSTCRDNLAVVQSTVSRVQGELSEPTLKDVAAILKPLTRNEETLERALRAVDGSISRGLAITGLILNYAQLGKDKPGDDEVSVAALVQRVLDDFTDDFREKHIAVRVSVPESAVFVGNEVHYHSILKNLVTNARDAVADVPATRERSITITLVDEAAQHVLVVSDTGTGIPDHIREKIFEPFFTTKIVNGTGLGLGVVRKLTMLYGGTIEVESVPERSTTFRITLPKAREPALPSAPR